MNTEEKRIGVYTCWCGTNISSMVDVEEVSKYLGTLPDVVISRDYKYMCSDPGQQLIIDDIHTLKLTNVVVASCSPRIHEKTFRNAIENAGLNPYMLEMANIREQVSWVHTDPSEATQKAKSLIKAAVHRVRYHEALEKRFVDINPATLVIGGGITGLSAALEIADSGKKVYLIEKTDKLGGVIANIDLTFPHLDSAQQILLPKINQVRNHPNIEVFLNSKITEIAGYVGNFKTELHRNNGQRKELEFGNIIVATGLKPFDPGAIDNYDYRRLPNVITSLEFEKMLLGGSIKTKEGKEPEHIAIVHCVGSRSKTYHEYCSRTCCMVALKFTRQIRSALPDAHIYDLYTDMRSFGKGCEEMYTDTSKDNIMFLMYDKEDLPEIKKADIKERCDMLISMNEMLSGRSIEIPADLVILMVGMEGREDAAEVARTVGISMCGNDFFIEKHPKLDPVATTTDGVYIAGSCQGPKDIPDSVAQAGAAAARVLSTISKGKVQVESITASVNEEICCGCQTCISVCPYSAISFDEEKSVSVVNELICKGCGTCGSACPTGAIRSRHFTDSQILSQIEGLFETVTAT